MSEVEKKVEIKKTVTRFLLTAIVFIGVGAVLSGIIVYRLALKYPDVLGLETTITQEEETKKVLEAVGKIMELPQDEAPTMTTAYNSEKKLAENYFENAKDGDKIIVYTNNKKIILFRPSENKIINVGFLTTPEVTATPLASETPRPVKTMRIALYNGTDVVGASKGIEEKIKEVYKDSEIVARAVATKTDYAETIVIDLTGAREEDLKKIASDLGAAASAFPEGEKKPDNSDFLVIVGKDKISQPSTPVAH